jgi:hypothetical protein
MLLKIWLIGNQLFSFHILEFQVQIPLFKGGYRDSKLVGLF